MNRRGAEITAKNVVSFVRKKIHEFLISLIFYKFSFNKLILYFFNVFYSEYANFCLLFSAQACWNHIHFIKLNLFSVFCPSIKGALLESIYDISVNLTDVKS